MPRKKLSIDIRDQRLRGERLVISPRTDSRPLARRREAAVRKLLEMGELGILERLRDRADPLHIADVQRAVEDGAIDRLRRHNGPELTLGAEVERLLRTVAATRSKGTLVQYTVITGKLLERFDASTRLRDIGSDALQDWLHEPKATTGRKPWSRARQRVVAAVVRRIFSTAIRLEAERAERESRTPRIARNPIANVELAGEQTRRVEFLQPSEWRTLSDCIAGRAVHALMALGTLGGLRAGEAASLRPGIDVDLGSSPALHIQPREGAHPWRPKSAISTRTVPIGPELASILRTHIERGFAGDRYLVRAPGTDRPLTREVVRRWTRAAFGEADIRYGRKRDALTFHSTRHTYISWLVQADVQLLKISLLAGTSVEMIVKVYGHLMDRDLRAAALHIDRRLQEAES